MAHDSIASGTTPNLLLRTRARKRATADMPEQRAASKQQLPQFVKKRHYNATTEVVERNACRTLSFRISISIHTHTMWARLVFAFEC